MDIIGIDFPHISLLCLCGITVINRTLQALHATGTASWATAREGQWHG